MSTRAKPDWNSIRHQYVTSGIGMRELASKTNTLFSTLSKRARREGWALERRRREAAARAGMSIGFTEGSSESKETAKVNNDGIAEAEAVGRKAGVAAARFLTRSITELDRWLDRIEKLASEGMLTPDSLGKLIAAWRATHETGRTIFQLDAPIGAPRPNLLIRLDVMAAARISDPNEPKPLKLAKPLEHLRDIDLHPIKV